MSAARKDLKLYLGTTFKETIKVFNLTKSGNIETRTPFDYTGYEAKMQIRSKPGHPDTLLELSTTDYSITLTTGQIELNKPKADVEASALEGCNKYDYDIIITDSGGSYMHIYGEIEVKENITNVS